MSNTLPQTHPSTGQLHWRGLTAALALLLVAVAMSVYFVTTRDDGPSATPVVHSISSGGPNEAARGQTAASASGVEPIISGGPNEAARGQATASAAGAESALRPGGADETTRAILSHRAGR